MVRQAIQTAPMRYSQRLALLKTAAAMGLGRFEANLILAIEQNRRFPSAIGQSSRNWSGALTILSIALLQSLILIGAFLIYHS